MRLCLFQVGARLPPSLFLGDFHPSTFLRNSGMIYGRAYGGQGNRGEMVQVSLIFSRPIQRYTPRSSPAPTHLLPVLHKLAKLAVKSDDHNSLSVLRVLEIIISSF